MPSDMDKAAKNALGKKKSPSADKKERDEFKEFAKATKEIGKKQNITNSILRDVRGHLKSSSATLKLINKNQNSTNAILRGLRKSIINSSKLSNTKSIFDKQDILSIESLRNAIQGVPETPKFEFPSTVDTLKVKSLFVESSKQTGIKPKGNPNDILSEQLEDSKIKEQKRGNDLLEDIKTILMGKAVLSKKEDKKGGGIFGWILGFLGLTKLMGGFNSSLKGLTSAFSFISKVFSLKTWADIGSKLKLIGPSLARFTGGLFVAADLFGSFMGAETKSQGLANFFSSDEDGGIDGATKGAIKGAIYGFSIGKTPHAAVIGAAIFATGGLAGAKRLGKVFESIAEFLAIDGETRLVAKDSEKEMNRVREEQNPDGDGIVFKMWERFNKARKGENAYPDSALKTKKEPELMVVHDKDDNTEFKELMEDNAKQENENLKKQKGIFDDLKGFLKKATGMDELPFDPSSALRMIFGPINEGINLIAKNGGGLDDYSSFVNKRIRDNESTPAGIYPTSNNVALSDIQKSVEEQYKTALPQKDDSALQKAKNQKSEAVSNNADMAALSTNKPPVVNMEPKIVVAPPIVNVPSSNSKNLIPVIDFSRYLTA
jgi:hypothetical protein